MPKKRTQEETISAFREKHGNKWCYEKFKYVNNNTLATITCPIHGDFDMQPKLHLRGYGCPKCGRISGAKNRTLTVSEFTSRSNGLHGQYSYAKSVYINQNTPTEIICSKHGSFWQKPVVHLMGRGCPKCGNEKLNNPRINSDEFFSRCSAKHNNKYNYSKSYYTGTSDNLEIVCPEHGSFWQNAGQHMRGSGCRKCAGTIKSDTQSFTDDSNVAHDFKYDYSLSKYVNAYTKVDIICPTHGVFSQKPNNHKNGQGCPKCASNGYDRNKTGYFYVLEFDSFVGFGVTNKLEVRLATHRRSTKEISSTMSRLLILSGDGAEIMNFEGLLKRKVKRLIVDSGISGFITESVSKDNKDVLLQVIKENLPEGRFIGT